MIYAVGIVTVIIPGMNQIWAVVQSPQFYPEPLEVNIEGGRLTTNTDKPVFFSFPDGTDEDYEHLVVIDQAASAQDLETYDTPILITSTAILTGSGGGVSQEHSFDEIGPLTITSDSFDSFITRLAPWVAVLIPVFATFLFVVLIAWLCISHGVLATLYAVLPYTLSRVQKRGYSFSQAVQISLHAYTIVLLLDTFLTGLVPPVIGQGVYATIYVIFIVAIFQTLPISPLKKK
jgi:hypothetical protein